MTKKMITTRTKTQKKRLLLNNHKSTQIQRQRQRQRQRKGTEKVPATPDIVTPCFPLGDHLATRYAFHIQFRALTPTNMLTPYWPFVKHLWNSKSQISSHIDHLMIVIKVFKRETDHLLLMKTIIRESVKILSALPLEASRSYQSIGLARRTSPITSDPFLRYRLFYH